VNNKSEDLELVIPVGTDDSIIKSEQQSEQQVNNKRTTSEQKVNTNKNVKNLKNVKKVKKDSNNITSFFDYWNTLEIIKHKQLTAEFYTNISKALSFVSLEELKSSAEHYSIMFHDNKYKFCDYKWGIHEFLTREEGYKRFMDDGSKWLNYLTPKKNHSLDDNGFTKDGRYKGFSQRSYKEKDIEDLYFNPFKETANEKANE